MILLLIYDYKYPIFY